MSVANLERGAAGEAALNRWLQAQQLSYVAVCQAKDSFATLFPGAVKRPDFLVLIDAVGLIAVDAKNYSFKHGVYTLELEAELRRSITFERLFRIPIWYAYFDASDASWYWISALKALEDGALKTSSEGKQFLAIPRDCFAHVTTAADLAQLYTHRLPGLGRIAALPLR